MAVVQVLSHEQQVGTAIASRKCVECVKRALEGPALHTRGPLKDMKKKTAFNEGHFWENVGMFIFVAAGLVGLWYMMNNILAW
jgi:hypothetical protein